MRTIGAVIGILGIIFFLTFVIQGEDFFLFKFYAPKYEQVRRQTFEQSRAFNQGMVQELENMQFQYEREKDPNAREALKSIILHRAAGYNLNDPAVSYNLRVFLFSLADNPSRIEAK